MSLQIEPKEDSPEKLAAVVGKPTKHYLFADEFMQIIEFCDNLELLLSQLNFQNVTDVDPTTSKTIKVGGLEVAGKIAFITSALTALRNINFQDKDGTVALLSDLTAIQEGIAWKQPVELNIDSPIAMTGVIPVLSTLTIQGVTLVNNSRVLLSNQTNPIFNGIYRLNTANSRLYRTIDADVTSELNNAIVTVQSGTYAGRTYRQTTLNPVINTSNIVFTDFGSIVANATNVLAGIAKLYNSIGNEIDGAITPKAVKDGLDLKADLSSGIHLASQSRSSNLTYNSTTGVVTLTDARGDTHAIDLPIENLFQNASYNSTTQKLSLTTNGGGTIEVDLATLVDLQEIVVSASSNPVTTPSTGQRLYFRVDTGGYWIASGGVWNGPFLGVTSSEKSIWNAKKDTAIILCGHPNQSVSNNNYVTFGINTGFPPSSSFTPGAGTDPSRRFISPLTGIVKFCQLTSKANAPSTSENYSITLKNVTQGTSIVLGTFRTDNITMVVQFSSLAFAVNYLDALEFEYVVPVRATIGNGHNVAIQVHFEKS